MKMKTLRKLKTQAPRTVRRPRRAGTGAEWDLSDATMEAEAAPAPEAVFDRITGPYGRRFAGAFDEET